MICGCWWCARRSRSRVRISSSRLAASSGWTWRRSTQPNTGPFAKTGDPAKDYRFLWVTDFPMFEWDRESRRWNAAHHPFTSLHDEDMAKLETSYDSTGDPKSALGEIRALAYDVVLNGTELGSGSIRIHRQDIQSKIFRALGMTEEEAKSRFGFFPGGAGVRHASPRRHRAGTGSHCDDPGRRRQPARSDPISQDRARGRSDGGCARPR